MRKGTGKGREAEEGRESAGRAAAKDLKKKEVAVQGLWEELRHARPAAPSKRYRPCNENERLQPLLT